MKISSIDWFLIFLFKLSSYIKVFLSIGLSLSLNYIRVELIVRVEVWIVSNWPSWWRNLVVVVAVLILHICALITFMHLVMMVDVGGVGGPSN